MRMGNHDNSHVSAPPVRSEGVLSDIRAFFLQVPPTPTLIEFSSAADRENYSHRIIQRLGIETYGYSVLNIHRIGIRAPARYVFEELLQWDGDSTCWPNYIAAVQRLGGQLEHIRILLLGRDKFPLGVHQLLEALNLIPLFNLNAVKIQSVPHSTEVDNARYLLYECSGGYPIGFFAIYVRSAIAAQDEPRQTQMFAVVAFNFYGKAEWPGARLANAAWEWIHNRVTANVLNRFKQLCEWKFQLVQEGASGQLAAPAPATDRPLALNSSAR